jgi:hypothetical protein
MVAPAPVGRAVETALEAMRVGFPVPPEEREERIKGLVDACCRVVGLAADCTTARMMFPATEPALDAIAPSSALSR